MLDFKNAFKMYSCCLFFIPVSYANMCLCRSKRKLLSQASSRRVFAFSMQTLTHWIACDQQAIPFFFFIRFIAFSCVSYVPASIAFVIPQRQNLSGALLKPLRAWDYPSSLPLVPKRRCLLVYVLFCIITIAYANYIFRLAIYQEFFH